MRNGRGVPAVCDVPCALCAETARDVLLEKRGWRYVRCDACRLVYVSPRHADVASTNAPMRHARPEYTGEASAVSDSRTAKYARRLRSLERYRSGGRLLEIGCREGHFLRVAVERDWDVTGIEPEQESAAIAQRQLGAAVHRGYLHDAALPTGAFDVVYLCEVLEHVVEPRRMLREIRRVLRPGGAVWIKTGNVESLSARRLGPRWSYFAYERLGHVTYYAPATLRRLLADSGFAVHSLRTWGVEGAQGPLGVLLGWRARLTGTGAHVRVVAERRR